MYALTDNPGHLTLLERPSDYGAIPFDEEMVRHALYPPANEEVAITHEGVRSRDWVGSGKHEEMWLGLQKERPAGVAEGECWCGCKQLAPLAKKNRAITRQCKGKPVCYIHGHYHAMQRKIGYRFKHEDTGYISVYIPDHPAARTTGYVFEHRLTMELHLKRWLHDEEEVHHKDATVAGRSDNRIENLELMPSKAEHRHHHGQYYHRWSRKYDACRECGTTTTKHAGDGRCYNCYIPPKRDETHPWSRDYAACIDCGTTDRPYVGKGMCVNCYHRQRQRAKRATKVTAR